MTDPIYLDHNATTPVAQEVLDAMLPWLRGEYGNPSSTHPYGQRAARAMATARGQVGSRLASCASMLMNSASIC
jgi:cysteine desulfurase